MKNQKGFTLIELLVVIAIIGLLSTLAVISLSTARGKARDAQRLSDVRQMGTAIDLEDASTPGTALGGCAGVDAGTATCSSPGDVSVASFSRFSDPSTLTPAANCATLQTSVGCDYSISKKDGSAAATTADYQICFVMEAASNIGAAGIHSLEPGGQFQADCT